MTPSHIASFELYPRSGQVDSQLKKKIGSEIQTKGLK